jgi:hypothetical protein
MQSNNRSKDHQGNRSDDTEQNAGQDVPGEAVEERDQGEINPEHYSPSLDAPNTCNDCIWKHVLHGVSGVIRTVSADNEIFAGTMKLRGG